MTVTLNIYNLGTSSEMVAMNQVLRVLGTGAFHCGVEVDGKEWSFESTGIFCCKPQLCEEHVFSETLPMGKVMLSDDNIRSILHRLEERGWREGNYNVLTRNCCHFCNAFCKYLGVGTIPDWITSLARTGLALADTVERVDTCGRSCASQVCHCHAQELCWGSAAKRGGKGRVLVVHADEPMEGPPPGIPKSFEHAFPALSMEEFLH